MFRPLPLSTEKGWEEPQTGGAQPNRTQMLDTCIMHTAVLHFSYAVPGHRLFRSQLLRERGEGRTWGVGGRGGLRTCRRGRVGWRDRRGSQAQKWGQRGVEWLGG